MFAWISGAALTVLCFVFADAIVSAFLSDPEAFDYAVEFSRILLSTSWPFGVFYVLTNALQAMSAATPALIINLSCQGIIFIPALFIMQALIGLTGLVRARPAADLISIVLAAGLYLRYYRYCRKFSCSTAGMTAAEAM